MVNYKPNNAGLNLTFDSVRFTIVASGTLSIQPATGECDFIQFSSELASDFQFRQYDGTNDSITRDAIGSAIAYDAPMISTNVIYVTMVNADSGATRNFMRAITTFS